MSNDNTITFRKTTFYFGVFAAAFVVVILVIFLCKEQTESRSKLASELEKIDPVAVPVLRGGGEITLLGPEGDVIKPCGKSGEKGEIIGVDGRKCSFDGITLKAAQTILVIQSVTNPACYDINVGGSWFEVHETTDTKIPKRWKRGHYPCHTANMGNHAFLN